MREGKKQLTEVQKAYLHIQAAVQQPRASFRVVFGSMWSM